MAESIGYVPGQPMQSRSASVAPADPGAKAPKPTSVSAITPQGTPVAPWNTNGGVTPNRYPYTPEQTEWAVESGTHA